MKYSCLKDCQARHGRCHIDCPIYTKRREHDEQQRSERHKETAVKVYIIEQKNKAIEIKRQHKRWRKETK